LANSSGQVGKHIMAHIAAKVYAAFDDRYVNNFMGPNAQKHALDDFNADNFDRGGVGFIRGSQIAVATASTEGGPIAAATGLEPPEGVPRWGANMASGGIGAPTHVTGELFKMMTGINM